MKSTRRTTLKSLASLALLAATPARASAPVEPINLIGSGSCGKRVLQLLDRCGLIERDFVMLHNHKPEGRLNLLEDLRPGGEPFRGRPIVMITAAGGPGAEHALRVAQGFGEVWRSEVNPVLFLPFAWEGPARVVRAKALAARLRYTLRRVATIDNQAIDDQLLPDQCEMSLLDLYEYVNTHALASISQAIRAARNA